MCKVGSRARSFSILCGAILPVWSAITPVFHAAYRPDRDFIDDEGGGSKSTSSDVKVPLARVLYKDKDGNCQGLVGVKMDDEILTKRVRKAISAFQTALNSAADPYDLPNGAGGHYMGLETSSDEEDHDMWAMRRRV